MSRRNCGILLVFVVALAATAWWLNRGRSVPDQGSDDVGFDRAHAEKSHRRMVAELQSIAQRTPDENPWLGDKQARKLRPRVAAIVEDLLTPNQWWDRFRLGVEELRLGRVERAVELLERTVATYERVAASVPERWRHITRYRLGVAFMRLAETENCCRASLPTSCLLPLRGPALHEHTRGALGAIAAFHVVLQGTKPDSELHRMALWLFNFAHMYLGKYPAEVPASFRVPAARFAARHEFPRFANVAAREGLDTFGLSGGAVADDFDGDGDLDLMVSCWETSTALRLFLREDGRFVDATKRAGLSEITGGLNLVQADYDNDGDLDVYVLRGAWLAKGGRHPNSLLRNEGDGTFLDVTFAAGLGGEHFPTQTAAWADVDGDGDLDLYVGNESTEEFPAPGQLFINDGRGRFRDRAREAGVTNDRYAKGVCWGDYDGDGDPDLFISNLDDLNRLYRNRGDGTFDDMAPRLGVTLPKRSFPCWFWDPDNDGDLDLYVGGYGADIWHMATEARGRRSTAERARMWRNDGHGRFRDAAAAMGIAALSAPMGANFGDLDNDGYLDFYLGTGFPSYDTIMPNVMYRNVAGARFEDVSVAGGFAHLQKGHAVAFADFDGDGDQDVFEQMGGAFPGDAFYDVLYDNPGFGNDWIALRLIGTTANRSAIGARIEVRVSGPAGARSIFKHVNSGGSFGANPLEQTIGLGRDAALEEVRIRWPGATQDQVLADVAKNRQTTITQPR